MRFWVQFIFWQNIIGAIVNGGFYLLLGHDRSAAVAAFALLVAVLIKTQMDMP